MSKFQIIEIKSGNHFDQGVQYGRQAKEKIDAGIALYRRRFAESGRISLDEVYAYVRACLPAAEQRFPEIVMEAKGVAEGAGVSIDDIMMLNCRYELTKYPRTEECTSFAVLPAATKNGDMLFGQNWDYCAGVMDNIVIIHIVGDDGMRILGITEAGQLVRHGMNSYGIGLSNNSIQSVHDSRAVGVPTCFLRRKVLECKTFEEATATVKNTPRAVSCNYLISSREGLAVDYEAYPGGIDEILPQGDIVTHANHFVVHPELHALRRSFRDRRLFTLIMTRYGAVDEEYLKLCLSDHVNFPKSICTHPEDTEVSVELREVTVASEIYNLTRGEAQFCYGPPCSGAFETFKL